MSPSVLRVMSLVGSVHLGPLSPTAAPLLLWVVPIAVVGWRWGPWAAWVAALAAIATIATRDSVCGVSIGHVGYVTRAKAFSTVAVLAGAARGQPVRIGRVSTGCADRAAVGSGPDADLLTARELEVLAVMAERESNVEIAERLVISQSTVQSHVRSILRKLGARNRTEAVSGYLRG